MPSLVRLLVFNAVVLLFVASQIFWFRRLWEAMQRIVASPRRRRLLFVGSMGFYVFLFSYNFHLTGRRTSPVDLTLGAALFEAPFAWWMLSSWLAFVVIVFFQTARRLMVFARWAYIKARGRAGHAFQAAPALESPSRRRLLEQAAMAAGALPFVADAYGLLYGRLNLETTHARAVLPRLPQSFRGFRILQLSDIHIGPFMPAEEIRRIVSISNGLKPDLMVLTGDFLTWDPETQEPVVRVLSELKAPFGVLGCLGNHELWTETEDSITHLFARYGIHILRQERAPIVAGGEMINIIGVDYQTRTRLGRDTKGYVRKYLEGAETLVQPGTVNILLSHNPNSFDRASELNIDLSLAGHTHGGQVALEFVHRDVSPSRLITPYVRGWFRKGAAQLYVNRGIGTIGVPIRLNAPPEITLFELVRA